MNKIEKIKAEIERRKNIHENTAKYAEESGQEECRIINTCEANLCENLLAFIESQEKEQPKESPIKGWVARDIHGTLRLYGNDAADGMGIRTGELPSPYKELTAADEPVEVELIIRPL